MRILVTGGAGYIGSHTSIELLKNGHDIFVFDDFSNSMVRSIACIKKIAKKDVLYFKGDIRSTSDLETIFSIFKPEIVMHFAGLKSVEESLRAPIPYYEVNISGTVNLLNHMKKWDCTKLVYSSSACIYSAKAKPPYNEKQALSSSNPYGRTKQFVEQILRDWTVSNKKNTAVSLRYFNPIGAHPSGFIGEDPIRTPNNIMPLLAQVASGKRPILHVFGNDYDTRDGTGERDFIHVVDLAKAHVAAIEKIDKFRGLEIFNLGTGKSTTVLELINAFRRVSGKKIDFEFKDRRPGDLGSSWADNRKVKQELGIDFRQNIYDMCLDSWRWINKA